MSTNLTRKALYELVWSQPRTHIAKSLGVSDVWIGKQCRKLNIPVPPAGYWASLAAGSKLKAKYRQPPLIYTVAERIQEDHDNTAIQLKNLELQNEVAHLPEAPAFKESVEAAVERYVTFLSKPAVPRRELERHPVVQRLLTEDDRLATLNRPYSWEQPRYRSVEGKAILAALDCLAGYWEACGFSVTASGRHNIRLAVTAPSYMRQFEIDTAPAAPSSVRRGGPSRRVPLAIWLDRDWRDPRNKDKPTMGFDDVDADTIKALTTLLVTKCEESFRANMVWRHQRIVDAKMQALRAAAEAERKATEEREAAIRALHNKRQRLLFKAVNRAEQAQAIRELVAGLQNNPRAEELDQQLLARWSNWALQHADALDLQTQSTDGLETWLRGFELDD